MSKELGIVKQDFKKDLKHLYSPSVTAVSVVEVPVMSKTEEKPDSTR